MTEEQKKLKRNNWIESGGLWDLLIGLRLYIILFFIIAPVWHLFFQMWYISPIGFMILGFSAILIIRFVLLEKRTASKGFIKFSLIILFPIACIIAFNFVSSLIINIIHLQITGIFFTIVICVISFILFPFMIKKQFFKDLNAKVNKNYSKWASRGKSIRFRRNIITFLSVCWLLVSTLLILLPYPVYIHINPSNSTDINESSNNNFGIWTYGAPLNDDNINNSKYIDNATLEMLGNAGIYFIYGLKQNKIAGGELVEQFNRCKTFNVQIHICVLPMSDDFDFVNIWSIEELIIEIDQVLEYLNTNNLLGDPVTTLVYDMEGLPNLHFPFYITNPEISGKLIEYYIVQEKFTQFNRHVEEDYGLKIRICSDMYQAIDPRDGDDDLMCLWGLMSDDRASMSYMIYRRDNFEMNYLLDHCRYLNTGDTIILNSWKFKGYMCWENIECAINEARLVLAYPGKTYQLEFWCLWYFLDSYGIEGLYTLVEALNTDRSEWPLIEIYNICPFSFSWDILFIGISLLDLYAPLFRFAFGAF